MTTEEKAKAYDEALKIARCWLNASQTIQDCNYTIEDAIQNIFSQLRESENERIRKAIVGLIEELQRSDKQFAGVELTDMLAYLEKQKQFVTIPETEIVKNDPMEMPSGESLDALADVVQTKGRKPSEDERIRKQLVDIVAFIPEANFKSASREDCRTYLEKQKEEEGYEAIPVKSTLEYKLGFKAGKESEKQKECVTDSSKTSADEDERIINLIRSLLETARSVQSNTSLYKEYDDALAYLEKQKEQKSAEYLDKDKIYAIIKKLYELSLYSDEYKKIDEITSDVRSLLDYPIDQQPAE